MEADVSRISTGFRVSDVILVHYTLWTYRSLSKHNFLFVRNDICIYHKSSSELRNNINAEEKKKAVVEENQAAIART